MTRSISFRFLNIMANNDGTSPAEHTPGPWESLRRKCHIGYADDVPEYFRIVAPGRQDDIGRTCSCPEQEANARPIATAPDLRQASQELYDRLQEYLDVSDDQLIEQGHEVLVEAMDAMEAAWHKADGTIPETH
jgi:hypothetical protein